MLFLAAKQKANYKYKSFGLMFWNSNCVYKQINYIFYKSKIKLIMSGIVLIRVH